MSLVGEHAAELVRNETTSTPAAAASVEVSTPTARRAPYPPTPESRPDEPRDRPPPFTRSFAKFDFKKRSADPYTHWGKPLYVCHSSHGLATTSRTGDRTNTPSRSTLCRRRAKARAKWPHHMPDVAYALEGVPQPKRRHGRTWAEVARDNFLAYIITLGVPRGRQHRATAAETALLPRASDDTGQQEGAHGSHAMTKKSQQARPSKTVVQQPDEPALRPSRLSDEEARRRIRELVGPYVKVAIRDAYADVTQGEWLFHLYTEMPLPAAAADHILSFDPTADWTQMVDDPTRYYLERSATDRDYWDAVSRIVAQHLREGRRLPELGPELTQWLLDVLEFRRQPPPKTGGRRAQRYEHRNATLRQYIEILTDRYTVSKTQAIAVMADELSLSPEAVREMVHPRRRRRSR